MAFEVDTEAHPAGLALPSDEIKRRIAEKAALVAELEARNPKPAPTREATPTEPPPDPFSSRRAITADGRRLAGLASRAKKLESAAAALADKAGEAQRQADEARALLRDYMRDTGLA